MNKKRILLKLSGEALFGNTSSYDEKVFSRIVKTIKDLQSLDTQIALVCGGGNIFRGKEISKDFSIEQTTGDYMGMLATIMNGLVLQSYFNSHGVKATAVSSFPINNILLPYTKRDALKILENKEVLILTGGVGSPFFTTDSGAALRSLELDIDYILMGKNGVDGVYSKDPRKYSDAKFIKNITYKEVLAQDLQVMDITALGLLKDSNVTIKVFNMSDPYNAYKIINGEDIGTTICK